MRMRWWIALSILGAFLGCVTLVVLLWPWLGGLLPHPELVRAWLRYLVLDLEITRWGPVATLLLVGLILLVWTLVLGRQSGAVERQSQRLEQLHHRETESLKQQIVLLKEVRTGLLGELDLHKELIREQKARLWDEYEDLQRASGWRQRHAEGRQEVGPPVLQSHDIAPDLPEPAAEVRNGLRQVVSQLERIEMVGSATARHGHAAVAAQQRADELMRLGTACYDLGQYQEALLHYGLALELVPDEPTALVNRAVVNMELERYQAALQDLDRALKVDEGPWAHFYRGLIRERQGGLRRAVEDLTRAIRLNPDFRAALHRRGLLCAELEEHDKAFQDQNRVLELHPNHAGALAARGMARAAQGDLQWALQDLDQACGLAPRSALAYCQRGRVQCELGDHSEALADFGRALELDPAFAPAYLARGDAYLALEDHRQAVVDYGRAIELQPENAATHYARGLARVALNEYRAAVEDFDHALELEPGMVEALASRGAAYEKLGNYPQAVADLDRAIVLAPTLAMAYYDRGLAYGNMGEYDQASRDLNRAVELDPSLAE